MWGSQISYQLARELGTYNTPSSSIAFILQILAIPCVILRCPLLSFPSITQYLPFPLASSSPLIRSCIPASLAHPKVCWNISITLMPSAPHPTWLVCPAKGLPSLQRGCKEPKPATSLGRDNSAMQKSRNFSKRFQPTWGRQRRHSVKVHCYIPGAGNQYSWYCVFSSQPKSFLPRLC